ncbi:hypothetical protein EOD23_33240 [Mesorhizobium sp. USDA-HM6]|nr:hypothetical protein EOD23_33240 [Mesorhizobium sp. USDA-HM6]
MSFSGRFSVSTATRSRTSHSTGSVIVYSFDCLFFARFRTENRYTFFLELLRGTAEEDQLSACLYIH